MNKINIDPDELKQGFLKFSQFIFYIKLNIENKCHVNIQFNIITIQMIKDIFFRFKKDEQRLILFHDIESLAPAKIIGIIIYWLLKIKPFTCTEDIGMNQRISCCINEYFAIQAMIYLIKMEINTDFRPTSKFYYELRYEFRYRKVTQSMIACLISAISGEYQN